MKPAAVILVICLTALPCAARTITVDANGTGDYPTIQAAIDDSNDADVIVLLPGRYTGPGNRDIDYLGTAITVRSTDPNDPSVVAATIIDCNGTWTEYHRGFYFHSGEDANSIVAGFTITNGYADDGGGIKCCYSSSPTISNCVITRNSFNNNGGGIYCRDSSPTLTNCTFSENWNQTCYIDPPEDMNGCGGAMCNCENSSPILTNCTFSGHPSAVAGGAIANYLGCNPVLTNCIFSGNWAEFGGAIANGLSSPILTNCTFSSNDAGWGRALMNLQNSRPMLSNCILWDGGDEIQNYDSTTTITYSNVHGGWAGEGNIDADPCFVELGYRDSRTGVWYDGDYHLKSQAGRWDPNSQTWIIDDVTSPCIDASDPLDPIGQEPFPNGGIVNMGAYGGTPEASKSYFDRPPCETVVAGDINGDCNINFKDYYFIALHWLEHH